MLFCPRSVQDTKKENLKFKPVKPRLKIDLVSHGRFGKYIYRNSMYITRI